jgi:predicted lipid-binding transport protein (Tim44 family)
MRQQVLLALMIGLLAMASMAVVTGCYSKPQEESKPAAPAESAAPPAAPAAPPAESAAPPAAPAAPPMEGGAAK